MKCCFIFLIKLRGNKAFVSARIINKRAEKTQYPARTSELPAIYSNGTYYRLYTYTGDRPFSYDELTLVPKRNVNPGEFPWTRFQATENWAALVNEDGMGMGVYSPVTQRFLGGFTGTEGEGSTFDIPCGYICPIGYSVLDHNIEYEYKYVMIAGNLEQIRKEVYELSEPDRERLPCYEFNSSRQGWYFTNTRDGGWPVEGIMDISPDSPTWSLKGPDISLQADRIGRLELVASNQGEAKAFSFHWNRIRGSELQPADSVLVDIVPGEDFHTYKIDLSGAKGFEGLLTGFRFNFYDANPRDRVRVERICFKPVFQ